MAGKPNLRSPWVPRIAIGIVGLLVLGGIISIAVGEGGPQAREIGEISPMQQRYGGIHQEGNRLGEPDSEVTVTVFNDPRCPSCGEYQIDVIGQLVDEDVRTGKYAMELRPYSFVKEAITYPSLGVAAAEMQSRSWQYIDLLYRNIEAAGAKAEKDFMRLVAEAVPHLEVEQWDTDFDSEKAEAILEANEELGFSLELPPTGPSVVVDGLGGTEVLTDYPSVESIRAAVDRVSRQTQ